MRRQASEQYSTLSQFLAQALRQLMGLAHTAQGLLGKKDLLPLNPVSAGFFCFMDGSVRKLVCKKTYSTMAAHWEGGDGAMTMDMQGDGPPAKRNMVFKLHSPLLRP